MISVRVGDRVRMKYGIPDQRIVGIYPMNHIPSPDRVDVVDWISPNDTGGIGIPLEWVLEVVNDIL